MIRFHVVGVGALGATMAVEICRRSAALTLPIEINLYDFDQVEERNCFSQEFIPADIGRSKVEAVARRIDGFPNVKINVQETKLLEKNALDCMQLDNKSIIIDAVDNIPTRQLLWSVGMQTRCPVLHVGMSQMGTGQVSWNYKDFDTFPFSPQNMAPGDYLAARDAAKKMNEEAPAADGEVPTTRAGRIRKLAKREQPLLDDGVQKLPPCELNAMRGLILNTSMAGVNALFTFIGKDITNHLQAIRQGGTVIGLMTCWKTTIDSHTVELDSRARISVASWGEAAAPE
jgi:molybdopterin/thiamine biosynthesis adenylyltransferase